MEGFIIIKKKRIVTVHVAHYCLTGKSIFLSQTIIELWKVGVKIKNIKHCQLGLLKILIVSLLLNTWMLSHGKVKRL